MNSAATISSLLYSVLMFALGAMLGFDSLLSVNGHEVDWVTDVVFCLLCFSAGSFCLITEIRHNKYCRDYLARKRK